MDRIRSGSLAFSFALVSLLLGACSDTSDDTSSSADAGRGATNDGTVPPVGGESGGCKRGIATGKAPGAAFSPNISWWYDWGLDGSRTASGITYVPMVWGDKLLGKPIPANSKFLLGFNEPNFHGQSNLTAKEAAAKWPMVETQAKATGAAIVSPAMNYCGPAANCNGTDPFKYLQEFFENCKGCRVDYVAAHWYNCDLPSLKDYIETGGGMPGFEQFGKPIWLTEFSCNEKASTKEQEAFMKEAVPWLESKASIFRYSWFSAAPIPSAKLVNDDGSPTPLGATYRDLPQNCSR